MVGISRSFNATKYFEATPPSAFQEADPVGTISTVFRVNRSKNRMMIASHEYPNEDDDREWSSRTWMFDTKISDWDEIEEFTEALKRSKDIPKDVTLTTEISADEVEIQRFKINTGDQEDEAEQSTIEEATIHIRISSSVIGFAVIPEPDHPIFPSLPVGEAYSPEGGASNRVNLDRVIELLEESQQKEDPSDPLEPTLDQNMHAELNKIEYGNEVVKHAQDGDICVEKGLLHLALSSYIHAIEWAAISYLYQNGVDIIAREQNGSYYNFSGGENSILDELKETADIDQKTVSQFESMNRAERRWMAHHKSGEVLPEEVEAVRARLSILISDLFFDE